MLTASTSAVERREAPEAAVAACPAANIARRLHIAHVTFAGSAASCWLAGLPLGEFGKGIKVQIRRHMRGKLIKSRIDTPGEINLAKAPGLPATRRQIG